LVLLIHRVCLRAASISPWRIFVSRSPLVFDFKKLICLKTYCHQRGCICSWRFGFAKKCSEAECLAQLTRLCPTKPKLYKKMNTSNLPNYRQLNMHSVGGSWPSLSLINNLLVQFLIDKSFLLC